MTTEGTVKFNMSFEWRDMSWHDKAACLGVDVEVFYIPDSMRGPSKQAHIYKAKNYCRVCPVQAKCLEEALIMNDTYAILGNTTPEERQRMK